MGAQEFTNTILISEVGKAFDEVVQQARYDHGSGGYSGTIAEKGNYRVVVRDPLHVDAARELADRMLDEQHHDKWGPAWAIPITTGTRTETVTVDDYRHGQELAQVVEPLVTLAKGESIQDARVIGYPPIPLGRAPQETCVSVEVTIDTGLTRTVDVEVSVPADAATGPDGHGLRTRFEDALREAATQKVRPRKGEQVLFGSVTDLRPVWGATQAAATKGKAVTRYLVHGTNSPAVSTWQGGFDTQAEARAWAIEAVEQGRCYGHRVEITAQTRREDDQPLVVVDRKLRKVQATVRVLVQTRPAPAHPDGWLFFGMASS